MSKIPMQVVLFLSSAYKWSIRRTVRGLKLPYSVDNTLPSSIASMVPLLSKSAFSKTLTISDSVPGGKCDLDG